MSSYWRANIHVKLLNPLPLSDPVICDAETEPLKFIGWNPCAVMTSEILGAA